MRRLASQLPSTRSFSDMASLPVAIIGAGPIGLAAAAHLVARGETPLVLEAGATVGASMLRWGHVRLFSPWRYNMDRQAIALLADAGWIEPDADVYPTGREIVERYLAPLAALPAIQPHLRLGARVRSVTRLGFDKMKDQSGAIHREDAPFLLTIQTESGEEQILARAVIDASGTYATPNPLGASGIPALGERTIADAVFYGIPDVLGVDRARYAGRRVLVVGSGHSAFNALADLATLADSVPDTRILWAVRQSQIERVYGGGENDALSARGALGQRVRTLVKQRRLQVVTGFRVAQLADTGEGIAVSSERETLPLVDEVIATTGFRPDRSLLAELRLALDESVESPVALAPLIDPNVHSCGTVPPHGATELQHPERDLYVVGMKSYGRAPTFLLLTGYEQVRSVVCALTGDEAGARAVELTLPETGVCSPNRPDVGDAAASGCATCCSAPVTVGAHARAERDVVTVRS